MAEYYCPHRVCAHSLHSFNGRFSRVTQRLVKEGPRFQRRKKRKKNECIHRKTATKKQTNKTKPEVCLKWRTNKKLEKGKQKQGKQRPVEVQWIRVSGRRGNLLKKKVLEKRNKSGERHEKALTMMDDRQQLNGTGQKLESTIKNAFSYS